MALSEQTRERISSLIQGHDVVLFMKGNRAMPQCGFSGRVVQVLDGLLPEYETVDVLQDPEIREGIKDYSKWPTIPQLYIKGELIGGADIVSEIYASGELQKKLGIEVPAPKEPTIHISDSAAQMIREHAQRSPGMELHLAVDARYRTSLGLAPREGNEMEVRSNGIAVLMDAFTAQRADGLSIDTVQAPTGTTLKIDNPNAPVAAGR